MRIKYLLFILIPFLIILFNFNFLVYDYDFYEENFDNGLNESFVKENTLNLFEYFQGDTELNDNFNEKEKLHLEDVKFLINNFLLIFYILSLIFIGSLVYLLYKKDFKTISFNFIAGGCLTLLLILILSLFDFSKLFLNLHLLIFTNNLWLLNPETDLLINIFTEGFFLNFFKRIILNSSIISSILILIGILIDFIFFKKITLK